MSNLYQDAILDAKALRASAIANAKAALEEAFEPKIQEMLRAKLSEEEVSEIAEAEEIKEEAYEDGMEDAVAVEESTEINEQELDEILAQLEELDQVDEAKVEEAETISEEKEEMEEAKDAEADHMEEAKEEEGEEADEEEAEAPEAEEEIVDDETKVIDITLGDLKQVLQSVMGAQADLGMPAEEPTADSEAEAEISLDEILDELALEEGGEDAQHRDPGSAEGHNLPVYPEMEESLQEKKEIEETINELGPELGAGVDLGQLAAGLASIAGSTAAIIKLQSWLKKNKPEAAKALEKLGASAGESTRTMGRNEEKELYEAKATIQTLRKDLQEVNLLNAKYLYMNKLFKSKSLTESQKVKVINALDRATTVAEVKNAYETLKESFETKKQQIKESIGFASKPAGVAPKANIVEADQFISRWQKLAGINK